MIEKTKMKVKKKICLRGTLAAKRKKRRRLIMRVYKSTIRIFFQTRHIFLHYKEKSDVSLEIIVGRAETRVIYTRVGPELSNFQQYESSWRSAKFQPTRQIERKFFSFLLSTGRSRILRVYLFYSYKCRTAEMYRCSTLIMKRNEF